MHYLGHVLSTTGTKSLPSKTVANKLMKPAKNAKQVCSISGTYWLLLQVHQEFCSDSKTSNSPYSSMKFAMDIRSPHSIQYPQNCFVGSTHPSLPRPFKITAWWYIDASDDVCGAQLSQEHDGGRTSSCIPFTHIYRHTVEMEHYKDMKPMAFTML